MENCSYVQLDRLVKEFIVPLEKQISSEQEEKQAVEKEKETQEIVGQKRRARTYKCTSGTSCASKEQIVAIGGTRRSKRVKVAPTRYATVVEEEIREASPLDSSGVVIRNTALTASRLSLDHSSATDETIMNISNEETNTNASRRLSATRRKVHKTFDERFKDLMAFKAKFGHCNVPNTNSNNITYRSLGSRCSEMRSSYKAMKEGGKPRRNKLSKADMKRLENAGFEWKLLKTFDDRFNDLMVFKAEFGHYNVPKTKSDKNTHFSLGNWCSDIRRSYKAIKEGGIPNNTLSKADMKRLEKAGFEWRLKK